MTKMNEESTFNLYTVKQFAEKNRKAGTWPDSENAIWAYRSNSPKNGFGKAFISIGRRVLINDLEFLRAIQRQSEIK